MVIVDTNVLIDVLQDDPTWAEWSSKQLEMHAQAQPLVINPVIYSELSVSYSTFELLEAAINVMQLQFVETPREALHLAGKAYVLYRRSGGTKTNVLTDFFIGAHASVAGAALLTRDIRRYATYFPTVQLISPYQ